MKKPAFEIRFSMHRDGPDDDWLPDAMVEVLIFGKVFHRGQIKAATVFDAAGALGVKASALMGDLARWPPRSEEDVPG